MLARGQYVRQAAQGFLYKMRFMYSHFPINVTLTTDTLRLFSDAEDSDDEFDNLLDDDLPMDRDLGGRRRTELEFILLPPLKPNDDVPVLIAILHGNVVATSFRLQGVVEDNAIVPHALRDGLGRANVFLQTPPVFLVLCRIRYLVPEETIVGTGEGAPTLDKPSCLPV